MPGIASEDVLVNKLSGNDNIGIQLVHNNNAMKIGENIELLSAAADSENLKFNAYYYYKGGAVQSGPIKSRPSSPLPTNNLFFSGGHCHAPCGLSSLPAYLPFQPPDHRITNPSPAVNPGADHIDAGCRPVPLSPWCRTAGGRMRVCGGSDLPAVSRNGCRLMT
jgi:hypothetical protein